MNKPLKFPPVRSSDPRFKGKKTLLSLSLLIGLVSSQLHAVPVTAPVIGEIEKITVNDINDHWSGGVIVAGGQNIIIPKNLLIDLPANRVTLQQLFTEASSSCQSQTETGLAKGDVCNATGTGGIATIHATRIDNGNVIAGDVFIQKGAESVTGQITYINYNDGYFRINGVAGSDTAGVMVRLNDPESRHTIQQGAGCIANSPNCSPDPRFTLDGDNYTNVFTTGYPLCIPSTTLRSFPDRLGLGITTAQAQADGMGDALCPLRNRSVQPADDSRRFAPILLGDSITAEGNYETVAGVRFLSAHTTMVSKALSTKNEPNQPDYLFLDEVEMDAPGFQNQRARTLIIGYATMAPADILIWSIHYDPKTNSPHEFPLATTTGCDNAGGVGTCTVQGLVAAGANIFKIRHDVDFGVTTKAKMDPCAHLRADSRFNAPGPDGLPIICPNGGTLAEQFAILSPIPHEIQARTDKKWASLQAGQSALITVDINGNEATNGQYLFPFGIGLGGVSVPEMNEIDLDAMATAISFSGIPWNLDRRLSPGGCLDSNNDGIGECESTPQPLDPFPFEGVDPRTLANIPDVPYSDPNYTSSEITSAKNRILSFVDPTKVRANSNGVGVNDSGNFTTAILDWQAPPPVAGSPGTGVVTEAPQLPQDLICSANSAFNTPPSAKNDTASTSANTPTVIQVLSNDSDVNGDTLTVTSVSTPANGTAAINPDGSIAYTPVTNFSGTDTFTYIVSDSSASVTGTVTVTVNPLFVPHPVANNDMANTNEDMPVTIAVLSNDIPDNSQTGSSVLSVASVTQPANGTVTINGTSVAYQPKPNFNGSDAFSYVLNDGRGGSATASVTVNVAPINDVPVAVNDNATVTSGATLTINVRDNDSDADGDVLTASLATATVTTTLGTVTTNGTTLTYKAKAAVTGTDTFSYSINDGHGGTATATVTVKVNAPVLDVITITRAQFITKSSEWRVEGVGNTAGKTITVRLGTSPTGSVVGTAPVSTLLTWVMRIKPGIQTNGFSSVTAWSSGGGKQTTAITLK
ncbi:MAG: tandem-95 repeat protein [Methylococcaceae bacterium]|nr:tandem-95 repeat protein [Methylococcaceae bacterium]